MESVEAHLTVITECIDITLLQCTITWSAVKINFHPVQSTFHSITLAERESIVNKTYF